MRVLSICLAIMMLAFALPAGAKELDGFRGFAWGSDIEEMQNTDPNLVEGHMGAMPGVKAYQRRDESLEFGGITAESITYIFYKGKFTSVNVDFRGFDNYEKLLVYCKKLFGPVKASAVMRQEEYADFETPKTGAMLLYQLSMQTTNYGRLYIYSKEFMK